MKRVFILTVEVTKSGDEKVDGNLELIKNSLEEILTAKADMEKFLTYSTANVISIKELWVTENRIEPALLSEDN